MPMITDRFKRAWNIFLGRDPTEYYKDSGLTSYTRPDKQRLHFGSERTIVSSIYNKIAIDVSSVAIRHIRIDENGRYLETIKDGLNECLTLEANKDQTARQFIQDLVISMFDEGIIAVVPVDMSDNPEYTTSFDIGSMRTAKILSWKPDYVEVEVYNDRTGQKERLILNKRYVSIIENPFYLVMNEQNSTLKRLLRKLAILDAIDEQSGSNKLNLIVQLPYTIRSEARRKEAEKRRKEIERQLAGSKYGVAYTDGTEHIVQLNRSIENNLMSQIEYLTSMLYSQLGLTKEVFDGTADEKTMLNYYNSTVEPILSAIVDEFKRKFLTKTARSQNQSIMYFKDSFKLVPVNNIADIADKFTRNEILSSNEIRAIIGYKPVDDARADELRNKNLNQAKQDVDPVTTRDEISKYLEKGVNQNE